jgi:hypothetical protein
MSRKFTLEEERKINGIDSLCYRILEQNFPWTGDNEERARAHYEKVDDHYVLILGKKVIGVEHRKEEAEKRLYETIKSHFNRTMHYRGDELEDRTSFIENKEEAAA